MISENFEEKVLVRNRLMRLIKEPLLQFLVIGACIYAAYAWYGPAEEGIQDRRVQVDSGMIKGFISEWERRWNRPPTREELDGVIANYVRETIFYQQALMMGLDQGDPITRRRMAQKLEFLANDLALLREPTESELEQFFVEHKDRYSDPDLFTFGHLFFDPDARDETTLDDAAETLALLRAAGVPDDSYFERGDRFMLENYYTAVSELDIRRRFGGGFSAALMELAPGQWHGPVLSGYGVHLVYIAAIEAAPEVVFADVRERVLEDWQAEQQEQFNAEYYSRLKDSYDIDIADIPVEQVFDDRVDVQAVEAAESEPAS